MPKLTGMPLEDEGCEVFTGMGLTCFHRLRQVRLLELHPAGSYSSDEHLEVDYLIPYHDACLIGEITGRAAPSDIVSKYRQFRRHWNVLSVSDLSEHSMWSLFGVPTDRLRDFREVRRLIGFMIVTELQTFDVDLPTVPNIVCFYKADWRLLKEYSQV